MRPGDAVHLAQRNKAMPLLLRLLALSPFALQGTFIQCWLCSPEGMCCLHACLWTCTFLYLRS